MNANRHRLHLVAERVRVRAQQAWPIAGVIALALILATTVAGAAGSGKLHVRRAAAPAEIEIDLETNLVAYDLCWADHAAATREDVAAMIAEEIKDPTALHVVSFDDLPAEFEPLKLPRTPAVAASAPSEPPRGRRRIKRAPVAAFSRSLRDRHGDPIDMTAVRNGRLTYEQDVEEALLEIMGDVRERRSGAMISVAGFEPRPGRRGMQYEGLFLQNDFVLMDAALSADGRSDATVSRRARRKSSLASSVRRAEGLIRRAGLDEVGMVALQVGDEWVLAADHEIPETLVEDPEGLAQEWQTNAAGGAVSGGADSSSDGQAGDSPVSPDKLPGVLPPDDGSNNRDDGRDEPPIVQPPDDHLPEDDPPADDPPADDPPADEPPADDPPADDPPADDPPADDPPADDPPADDPPADDPGGDDLPDPPADDPPADDPAPDDVGPFIIPGAGFAGTTPTPAPIGSPNDPGYDAKAIARWDVAPYQTFDGLFNVGVVAFHMNGIDRVEFSADGGPWVAVDEMRLNPRTDVVEYWATLDAADFDDGLIEVRAVVYPVVGEPRVLGGEVQYQSETSNWYGPDPDADGEPTNSVWTGEHSLFLYTNAGETLPSQTYELQAGEYTWGEPPLAAPFGGNPDPAASPQHDQDRWIVFRAASGVDRSQVVITDTVTGVQFNDVGQASAQDYRRVKFEDVTIQVGDTSDPNHTDGVPTGLSRSIVWYDNVHVKGKNPRNGEGVPSASHLFVTSSLFTDHATSIGHAGNWGSGSFVRGTTIRRLANKAIRAAYLVLDTTIEHLDSSGTDFHASAISNPIMHDNRVYQDVTIRMTGEEKGLAFRTEVWHAGQIPRNRDVAVVGCDIAQTTVGNNKVVLLGGTVTHMYVKDTRLASPWPPAAIAYRLELSEGDPRQFQPDSLIFESVNFNDDPDWFPDPHPLPGVSILD